MCKHDGVGDDVAAHAKRFARQRHCTAGRNAEPFEREELEVGPVVAGRLQARGARPLCDPGRGAQLLERPSLASARVIPGELEEIRLELSLANAFDRVTLPLGLERQEQQGKDEERVSGR